MAGDTGNNRGGTSIDKEASLDSSCIIGQGVRLFGRVELQRNVRIEPNSVAYGPARIASGSFIGPNVTLGFPTKTELTQCVSQRWNLSEARGKNQLMIGERCIVRSGTCIYSDVSIGDEVSLGHNVMIREKVRIGNGSMIGTGVAIDGSCEIGERVSIQTGVYISTNCRIEDSVFLGPHALLTNDKYVGQKKTRLVGPTIRRGASIGANSLLMPSIEIGEGSVIGAQSLVTRDVPPRSIYVGIPAKRLKRVPTEWRSIYLRP